MYPHQDELMTQKLMDLHAARTRIEEARRVTNELSETAKNELVGDFIEIVPFHPNASFHETEVSVEDEQASEHVHLFGRGG